MAKSSKGRIELDIRDSVPDWDGFLPDKAPEGAPNVLVVLYDDTGLAACSPYGGRIAEVRVHGGKIVKVVFDIADDAYVDVEAHLAAAMARD